MMMMIKCVNPLVINQSSSVKRYVNLTRLFLLCVIATVESRCSAVTCNDNADKEDEDDDDERLENSNEPMAPAALSASLFRALRFSTGAPGLLGLLGLLALLIASGAVRIARFDVLASLGLGL